MEFRTPVELPKNQVGINHSHKIMLMGSCFAENIGMKLVENKFQCDINPCGILYNPYSIFKALYNLVKGKPYKEEDLFFWNGMWHSNMHHTSFSDISQETCLKKINTRFSYARRWLYESDYLIITLGTAYYYVLNETNEIVGNCHKRPENMFTRCLLDWNSDKWGFLRFVVEQLLELNPKLKVIFTVSPVRYGKEGMHANQLSKSTLMLFINYLFECSSNRGFYFPAYEIMMDELRDYRFYADDMLHPSKQAVDYIWECFSKSYFNNDTMEVMKEWGEIRKGLNHKPFHAESEEYKTFLRQLVLKINRIKEKCPYLDVQKELELCHILLKQ